MSAIDSIQIRFELNFCPFIFIFKFLHVSFVCVRLSFFGTIRISLEEFNFSLLWTSLLWMLWELARGGSAAVALGISDRWQVTLEKRHMTHEMWQVICDTWNVTWPHPTQNVGPSPFFFSPTQNFFLDIPLPKKMARHMFCMTPLIKGGNQQNRNKLAFSVHFFPFWYWRFYLHRSRDIVSPVCGILKVCLLACAWVQLAFGQVFLSLVKWIQLLLFFHLKSYYHILNFWDRLVV